MIDNGLKVQASAVRFELMDVLSNEEEPIVVFGGTGHYGRYIVESLVKKQLRVRVLSRSAPRARSILGDKVEIVEGDITDQASIVRALENARAVVISVSAFSSQLIRNLERIERDGVLNVIQQAERSGIQRLIYVSVYDIQPDVLQELNLHMPIARIKLFIEQYLAASTTLNWTVLGAAPSMEIFFAMCRGSSTTMLVPGGGPPALPTVSPVDLGEIAAQAVIRDNLNGERFRVTGPEALSFPQAAERMSIAMDATISVRNIPLVPLRLVALLSRPFNPFLWHLIESLTLMNHFPQDLVQAVPKDHQRLLSTFDYVPLTLEAETQRRT